MENKKKGKKWYPFVAVPITQKCRHRPTEKELKITIKESN